MTNSMDTVLVKYGKEGKSLPVPKFLALKSNELSPDEQKIQNTIRLVYDLNGKEPPFYKGFPNYDPKKPLTINCTRMEANPALAIFFHGNNEICFFNRSGNLVGHFAHELKHAEQYAQSEIRQIYLGSDNRKKQEIWAMDEGEAYFTGARAYCETTTSVDPNKGLVGLTDYINLSKKYTHANGTPDYQKIKQEMMAIWVPLITRGFGFYPLQREMCLPLTEKDSSLQHIPKHYGLTDDFFKVLQQIPREPITDCGQVRQCFAKNRTDLLVSTIRKIVGKDPANAKGTKREILKTFLNDFYVFGDRNMAKTLLQLKNDDGKPVFDKSIIIDVLCDSVLKGKEKFKADLDFFQSNLRCFQDDNSHFTSADFNGGRKLLKKLHVNSWQEMLPFLLKGKCSDAPLITPVALAEKFVECTVMSRSDPEHIQQLLDIIKDKNGALPISCNDFNLVNSKSKNSQNMLLEHIASTLQQSRCIPSSFEKWKKYYLSLLPILMSLKGKDGKPIISQENIQNFPANNPLKQAISAYLKPQKTEPAKLQSFLPKRANQPNPQSVSIARSRKIPQSGG